MFCCVFIVVYNDTKSQSIIITDWEEKKKKNEPLIIKKRGEDGSRVITVRIREEILAGLDKVASETNYSRNELINLILEHGLENIEIA